MSVQKRDFDNDAAQWDIPPRVKMAKEIAAAIAKRIPLKTTMDVMDFGCGTGLLITQLSPLVKSFTGVDSSIGMLDILNKKISDAKLANVQTRHADPDQDDKLEGQYDLVVSNLTLHHIKKTESLINEFYRILKPEGFLCIADLDLEQGQFHPDNSGIFHFGFDRNDLQKTFEKCGFKNVIIETAATISKPVGENAEMKQFTIFLISGQKI